VAAARYKLLETKAKVIETKAKVIDSRDRHPTVDIALEMYVRDTATGGAILAGAIAFRFFLWTLPATLFLVGLLGFSATGARLDAVNFGLGGATASTIAKAAEEASHARWWLITVGAVLLVSVSRTLGVTVYSSYALTWQLPIRKAGTYLKTAGLTAAIVIGMLCVGALCSWLRHNRQGIGIWVTLTTLVIWTLIWWGISVLLPHRPVPWWGLLPGATFVGIGMVIMHLVIVFYLIPKVTSSSALYGGLGSAATLLLGAYILSRIVLAAASLNATIAERMTGSADVSAEQPPKR
jgi:uncharacterized BrkB/YihY/UPF0761 family membrane protein